MQNPLGIMHPTLNSNLRLVGSPGFYAVRSTVIALIGFNSSFGIMLFAGTYP